MSKLLLTESRHDPRYENIECHEGDDIEKDILGYSQYINPNQLFELDFNLHKLSQKEVLEKQKRYLEERFVIMRNRLNIITGKGQEEELKAVLTNEPDVLISSLAINFQNVEMLDLPNINFSILQTLKLSNCKFSTQLLFDTFVEKIQNSRLLGSMSVWGIRFLRPVPTEKPKLIPSKMTNLINYRRPITPPKRWVTL